MQQGKYAQSEIGWRELISSTSTSTSELEDGKKKLSNLGERSNLPVALNGQKKFVEAEEVIMDLLPELQEKFGEVDPRTSGCRRHLMSSLVGQGRLDEARALFWDMMEKSKRCEEVHRAEEIEAVEEFRGKLVPV